MNPARCGRHSFTVHFFLKLFNQIVNYNYVIYWGYGRFSVFFKSKALIYRKSKPLVSPFALSIHVKLKKISFKIRFSVELLWLITVAIFLIASTASWAVNSMDWDTYNSFYCCASSSSVTYATKNFSLQYYLVMLETPPNFLKPIINAFILKRAVEFFPLYSVVDIFPLLSSFFSVEM